MRRALLVAALTVTAAGCGGGTAAAAPTFTNPKGTVKVDRNERFDLVFKVTPGTGFSWKVTQRPDPALARYVKSVTLDGGNAPGAAAMQHLVFRSRDRAGTTTVKLADVGPGRD